MQIWEAFGVHTGYRGLGTAGAAGPGHALHHFVIFILAEIDEIEDRKTHPAHISDDRGYF